MQADHNPIPASGVDTAGKPVHAFPQSLPKSTGEEVRDLRAAETASQTEPVDADAYSLPQPLQSAAAVFTKAHLPLQFLLQSALIAISPFAEILGMREASARAARWGRR